LPGSKWLKALAGSKRLWQTGLAWINQ